MTVEYLSCVICLPTAFLLNAALICGCFSLCLVWRTQRQQRFYEILSACKLSLYIEYFIERARICKCH